MQVLCFFFFIIPIDFLFFLIIPIDFLFFFLPSRGFFSGGIFAAVRFFVLRRLPVGISPSSLSSPFRGPGGFLLPPFLLPPFLLLRPIESGTAPPSSLSISPLCRPLRRPLSPSLLSVVLYVYCPAYYAGSLPRLCRPLFPPPPILLPLRGRLGGG